MKVVNWHLGVIGNGNSAEVKVVIYVGQNNRKFGTDFIIINKNVCPSYESAPRQDTIYCQYHFKVEQLSTLRDSHKEITKPFIPEAWSFRSPTSLNFQ